MTVTADEMPVLVTIPNVELVTTGTWQASTGEVTFTEDDLRAAVAALDDPAVKAPRLRIGHTQAGITPVESAGGFADQPAFGRFANLRLGDNGQTIVADMVGVPAWLAEILPSAFPSRSVEAYFDVETATGKQHEMVITSVALLGVSMPAVQTLEDLRLAYGAETPAGVEFVGGTRVAASRGETMPERVSASVQAEDVRRSFYEDFATDESGRYWWWIHSLVIAPSMVIADDDEGGLWAVPYSIKGDTVTWGDPVEVRVQYVEKDSGKVAASRLSQGEHGSGIGPEAGPVFASAAESRPKDRVRAANQTKEERMAPIAPTAVLERLGLAEDATEEQILAALDSEQTTPDPTPDPDPDPDPTPDPDPKPEAVAASGVTLDEEQHKQLLEDARMGREAREAQVNAAREQFVDDAIKAGKFPPSRRDHYLALMSRDEQGTREFVDGLAAGAIPTDERAQQPSDIDAGEEKALAQIRASFGLSTTTNERG